MVFRTSCVPEENAREDSAKQSDQNSGGVEFLGLEELGKSIAYALTDQEEGPTTKAANDQEKVLPTKLYLVGLSSERAKLNMLHVHFQ